MNFPNFDGQFSTVTVPMTVFVAVSITAAFLRLDFVTYTFFPSGVIAIPVGSPNPSD